MIHLPHLITDLGLILGAAALVTLLFKKLKQPLVLGYLIAGFLVGPNFRLFPTITEQASIQVWAEIGVIFLLFSLGLEFSFKKLLRVGAPASITAIVKVAAMLFIGYLTGQLLGWSRMDSIFLGGILSISSTTITIRAFEELGVKSRKFAGLVFGTLIVEDLVAIVLLVLLSTLAVSAQFSGAGMLLSVGKLVFFLMLWFLAGIFILPTALRRMKKLMSDETLLITALALCLTMVWLATAVGFSAALGAFVMGSILAETTYAEKIEHLIKGVKDLFGAVFFVSVGMLIDPAMLSEHAVPILIITLATIVGKLLGSSAGALLAGQSLKTSIQAGMSLSQIGEFSFIIATLGLTLKVTSPFLYPIAVAVSAITTFTTPYLIKASEPFYHWVNRMLPAPVRDVLNRYSSRSQSVSTAGQWQLFLRSHLINALLQTVIIVAMSLLAGRYLLPFIQAQLGDTLWNPIIALLLTFAATAPFLWALAIKQPRAETIERIWEQTRSKGAFIFFQVVRLAAAILLTGFLIDRFFSPNVAIVASVAIVALLLLFSKRIQNFYLRIEDRFLANYNEREAGEETTEVLAPWDAHLAVLEVKPEWPGVGKSLQDLRLREQFGINIASIERGAILINTPGRHDTIFPFDSLSVIGTDEQLDRFRQEVELVTMTTPGQRKVEVVLWHFEVGSQSDLVGRTIRESRIRERTHGIVVGIESHGQRIINPDSGEVFHAGDEVWIVGEKRRLLTIKRAEEAARKAESREAERDTP
jgi:monovalent cation:H+ antiporter-2, CPA2 family